MISRNPVAAFRRGFTLVELLSVIAIIGILSAMSFSLYGYVQTQKKEARARGEVALLTAKLEEFKSRFGEYPIPQGASQQDGANALFNALTGRWTYTKDADGKRTWNTSLASGNAQDRRPILEEGLVGTDANRDTGATASKFVDPWGNDYRYRYGTLSSGKLSTSWDRPGFLLISAGNKFSSAAPENDGGTVPDSNFFAGAENTTGVVPETYFDDQYRADNITNFNSK